MALAKDVDLPPSLACLKNMDTLLRCPICFDFLSISMMSQCSHNYCSLCIRKFLSYKLQCPVCKLPMTEQDLRNNRILDDLVKSFQDARKQLSQVQFESPPISPKTPSAVKRKAPAPAPSPQQRGPKKDGSVLSHFFQKQPCAASSSASAPRGEPEAPPPRGKRARTSALRTAALRVKQEPVEEEVPQAAQHASTSTRVRVKEEKTDCELSSPSTSQDLMPVVKVECPVCEVPVSQQHINKHLDTCLRSEEKKDALRSSGRRKTMAKVVYNLLSLVELRRRLRECHLPTQGTKEQLIRRHQDFLHIYNAECDAEEPRSAEVIAKEVETNEKMRMQLDKTNKRTGLVFRKDQTEDEIEAVHSNYPNLTEAVEQSPSPQGSAAASEKPAPDTKPSLTEIISRSPSPSPSEVSISSSISDVFS
ncbi:E3 ubiquitin-protein ligase RAD18 isoform X2 [Sardina pilchardus]|uniref:E3 ubiquitin-protein ligase RAD18 isoform X2 n=1 Tax=Sardina pilchardus TaxID=27697 RepID=UPI002E0ED37E